MQHTEQIIINGEALKLAEMQSDGARGDEAEGAGANGGDDGGVARAAAGSGAGASGGGTFIGNSCR